LASLVTFVKTYAVWIYLFLIFGILVGINMLVDAQRLSRTTLFSLDQERATEQTYRGLILIGVLLVAMFVVTGLVLFVAPLAPAPESPLLRGVTATLPVIIFPTNTPLPTATPTLIPATETPFRTATPAVLTATRIVTRTIAAPPPSPTSIYLFPAPKIVGPIPNGGAWTGEGQANAALTFRWTWDCPQCKLGPDDRFVITISFIDRSTGAIRFIGGGTQNNFLSMADIIRGSGQEVWHQAKDDTFQWFVQVKRGEQPLSPPSETWKFIWH
jgi:hypothetical protein